VVFCLQDTKELPADAAGDYPLAPFYLVQVGHDGAVVLPYPQAKQILDLLKRQCIGRELPDPGAQQSFDAHTKNGRDMTSVRDLLAIAAESIQGKKEEKSVDSHYAPGGTTGTDSRAGGTNSFEVVAFLVVLPGGE
jgi:hypothetical protein